MSIARVHYVNVAGEDVGASPLAEGPSTTAEFFCDNFLIMLIGDYGVGSRMSLCLDADRCFVCKRPPRRSERRWRSDPTRVVHLWGHGPSGLMSILRDVRIEFDSAEEMLSDPESVVRDAERTAYPILCCESAPCFLCCGDYHDSAAGEVHRLLDAAVDDAPALRVYSARQ